MMQSHLLKCYIFVHSIIFVVVDQVKFNRLWKKLVGEKKFREFFCLIIKFF